MDDWILNEEDEWDQWQEPEKPTSDDLPNEHTLTGHDAAGVVSVHVTPRAEVVAVKLANDWKRDVDPRTLHTHVLAAANAATAQALANQLEAGTEDTPSSEATGHSRPDVSSYNKEDVSRLLDAVTADLDQFSRQLSSVVDQPTSARSSGGHASGSAQRGQILALSLDGDWLLSVRNPEIESELLDVLRHLRDQSSPGELENGPQSSAITELNTLAQDPQKLLRAVGLPPLPPQ